MYVLQVKFCGAWADYQRLVHINGDGTAIPYARRDCLAHLRHMRARVSWPLRLMRR